MKERCSWCGEIFETNNEVTGICPKCGVGWVDFIERDEKLDQLDFPPLVEGETQKPKQTKT